MQEKIIGFVPNLEVFNAFGSSLYCAVATSERIVFLKLTSSTMQGRFMAMKEFNANFALIQKMSLSEILASHYEKITVPKLQLQYMNLSQWPLLFKSKIQIKSTVVTKTFKLAKKHFLQFKTLFEALKSGLADTMPDIQVSPIPVAPVDQSSIILDAGVIPPGREYNRKRYWAVAFALLGNALLSVGLSVYSLKTGAGVDAITAVNIGPWVIDVMLAIALLSKRDVLQWVFIRAVIGGIIWTMVSITQHQYLDAAGQLAYSLYFIILTKGVFTEKKFKFSMALLVVTFVLLVGSFYQGFTGAKAIEKEIQEISLRLETYSDKQISLLNTETDSMSHEELQAHYTKLKEVSVSRGMEIDNFLGQIALLNKNNPMGKEKNILDLTKSLVDEEKAQNKVVVEFSDFMVGLDYNNITTKQEDEFNRLFDEIERMDGTIAQKKALLENAMK